MKTKTMGGRGLASLRAALVMLCLLVSAAMLNAANPINLSSG